MKCEVISPIFLILLTVLIILSCAAVADVPVNMTGYYEIRSNVENASVYFNGEFAGNIQKGSLLVPAELSSRPVSHKLMIQAPGYTTYNETIVQAPKPDKSNIIRGILTAIPPPKMGTLSLAVSPPGGEVFVDEVSYGIVDKSGIHVLRDIGAGYRNIQIVLPGYKDWFERVYVESNMITKVRVALTQVTTGSLQVSSEPAAANVLLNGTTVGVTPVTISDLPPGPVMVTLTLSGYQDWNGETSVMIGQTVPVFGALAPVVIKAPEPVNVTPEETPTPEPTQSAIFTGSIIGALAVMTICAKKR
ncbi:PEGA domain-containing protein [Methanospirillum sp.]|uniref:PEGA domain-containing protein n=1 Tax=Methanospirillum sp. TaxID=45200 RepID=UPI00359F9F15